jgi:hypothetical protein
MAGNDKDGYCCSIWGDIPPDKTSTKRVIIGSMETGIDHLDFIFENEKKERITDEGILARAILVRAREFNYIPKKREARYAEALLREYRQREAGHV